MPNQKQTKMNMGMWIVLMQTFRSKNNNERNILIL